MAKLRTKLDMAQVAQPGTGVKWVDDCLTKAKHKDVEIIMFNMTEDYELKLL